MNTTENRYGGAVGLDVRIAEVFQKWGFAWGGAWPFPDGGHFEWKRPPVQGPVLVEG